MSKNQLYKEVCFTVTDLRISACQLQLCKGISYAAVAAHADKNGRRKLAAMLIEHEPVHPNRLAYEEVVSLMLCFCNLMHNV